MVLFFMQKAVQNFLSYGFGWGGNERALHHFEVTNTYVSVLNTLCPLTGPQIKALV